MSEYLNKKAVLDWLREERDWYEIGGKEEHLDKVIAKLQSGAFDADESEGTWKATSEFAFRLNDQLEAEVQRLRATLEKTVNCSTPTEPSGAERDITEVYVVRNRYKDILYVGLEWNEVEELLAQDASYEYLSYGINSPEGDGNDI